MNKKFEKLGFYPADILLPKGQDMTKWAVVACDQFTSEPEYWQAVEQQVGDAPSTLRLILPEANLKAPNVDELIGDINTAMSKYLADGVFETLTDSLIYIERQQSDGKLRHGLQLVVADAPAAYREPVVRRVVAFIKRRYIPAREFIVLGFVGRDAVGVRGPEKGAGESLAGLGVDLRAFDGQPLLALGAVGAQFLLGENGVQEYLFGYGERFVEEFGEHAETDVGIVAVDVDVVVRAVIVEPFGDLVRRHVARAFGEKVGGGRRREGRLLEGRSGAEDERDAQHLEIVGGERVESDAVG